MAREGRSGELATLQPPLSPLVWTSMMTGVGPLEHGILDFTRFHPVTGEREPITSDERRVPAVPGLVLFPRYEPGAQIRVETLSKARAFAKLAVNSFNYEILGPDGFDAVGRLLQAGDVYRLGYGSLPDAIDAIAELVSRLERHA